MGSVVIHLVIKGQEARPVELTRVLHVPQLRNNLLACLYLTKHKGIRLEVNDSTMFFKRDRRTSLQLLSTPRTAVSWTLQLSQFQSM
jgi:hypothetical protein